MTVITTAANYRLTNYADTFRVSHDGDMVERDGYKGVLAADHPLVVRLAGELGIHVVQIQTVNEREHKINCGRCEGTGTVRAYVRVNGGVCYDCDGDGVGRFLTVFQVAYVAAGDLPALRVFHDHLNSTPDGDVFDWFFNTPAAPEYLYADVS